MNREEPSELNFDFKPLKKVSKKRIKKMWGQITQKPFPSVEAYILDSKEYERVMMILKESPNIVVLDRYEYGERVDLIDSNAVVFHTVSPENLVLIREEGSKPIKERLRHELEHMAHGEVRLRAL